jgi:hypothetical protein
VDFFIVAIIVHILLDLSLFLQSVMTCISESAQRSAFYVIGCIAILACTPRLFAEDGNDAQNSELMIAVRSDYFRSVVVGSLGISIPFGLDVIVNFFAGKNKYELDKHSPSRLTLFTALLVPNLLAFEFSLVRNKLIASWAIQKIQTILILVSVVDQFYIRCVHVYNWYVLLSICSCAATSMALSSYTTDLVRGRSDFAFASFVFSDISVAVVIYATCKHVWMFLTGRLEAIHSPRESWQTTAIEVITLVAIIHVAVVDRVFAPSSTIYELNAYRFAELAIHNAVNISLLQAVLNTEMRYFFAVNEEKLATKRLFVRFISHEVRRWGREL